MLYANADITGYDWWSLYGRRYLLAVQKAVGDLRIIWRQRVAIQAELVELEFHPLLKHLGGGPQRCTVGFYHGDVVGASDYIARPETAAPKNIALVTWPTDRMQGNLVTPLGRYDAIVVPTDGAKRALVASGIDPDKVHVVPVPTDLGWWKGAKALMASNLFVFYAIGEWDGFDNTQAVVRAYLREFTRHEEVLLYLCCPDSLIRDPGDLAGLVQAGSDLELPLVAPEAGAGCLQGTSVYWRQIHRSGNCYVSASRRLDFDPWAVDAIAAGNRLVIPSTLADSVPKAAPAVVGYAAEVDEADDLAGERGVGFGQQAGAIDEDALRKAMRAAAETVLIVPGYVHGDHAVENTSHRLKEIIDGVVRVEEVEQPPQVDEADDEDDFDAMGPTLGVVIPHRGRGLAFLEPCVDVLMRNMRHGDDLIIVDQQSDPETFEQVKAFCAKKRSDPVFNLVRSPATGPWNLSAARNAGATLAEELGHELVMFLDCDILLADGYLEWARGVTGETSVAIPRVAGGETFVTVSELRENGFSATEEPRKASGLAMMTLDVLDAVGGYDEAYKGWGSEDIDFLARARQLKGVEPVVDDVFLSYHQPHEENPEKAEWARPNLERVRKVLSGDVGMVNEGRGWRGGEAVVVRGEER